MRPGHSSSSQYWNHKLRSKDHLHWGSAKGLFKTAPAGDRTMETLNMNTAFKCISHILGNLQLLPTVEEFCADAHYYFAHSFNFPWGSKASSMCPVRRALTRRATMVRLSCLATYVLYLGIFCLCKKTAIVLGIFFVLRALLCQNRASTDFMAVFSGRNNYHFARSDPVGAFINFG